MEKVRFLKAIGVEEQVIGQVLVKFPALFSYSLDKKIRPLVIVSCEAFLFCSHILLRGSVEVRWF